jgi:hypothetical protein
LTSGRFPWDPVDGGAPPERDAATQQAAVARWVIEQMTRQGISQRELERTGVASQSAISGLLTGRTWTDMWVVARIVGHLGGHLRVWVPNQDR